jgi:transcriptional regulator with XRE-family HTH domain
MSAHRTDQPNEEPEAKQSIGEKLRELREARGLSRVQLAEAAGLRMEMIALLEDGTASPGFYSVGLICEALGISLDTFVDSKEEDGAYYAFALYADTNKALPPRPNLEEEENLAVALSKAEEACREALEAHDSESDCDCDLCVMARGTLFNLGFVAGTVGDYLLDRETSDSIRAAWERGERQPRKRPRAKHGRRPARKPRHAEAEHEASEVIVEAPDMGTTVNLLRKRQGLTPEQLAATVGLSTEQVRQLEAGTWQPDLRTLVRMAGPLGVSDDDDLGADKPHVAERDGQERGHG